VPRGGALFVREKGNAECGARLTSASVNVTERSTLDKRFNNFAGFCFVDRS
jgi:hypothetical protein